MKVRVQIVIESDDADPPVVHEVAHLERSDFHIDTLGLQLAEAKDMLQHVQEVVVSEQVRTCLAEQVACPDCGRPRRHKDTDLIVVRTLFGTLHLRSPRWWHCLCQPQPTRRRRPIDWRPSSALSSRCSSKAVSMTGMSCRGRTCR